MARYKFEKGNKLNLGRSPWNKGKRKKHDPCIDCGKERTNRCKLRCEACYAKWYRTSNRKKWSEYQKKWASQNRERTAATQARYRFNHPDRVKAYNERNKGIVRESMLRRKYGITREFYDNLLKQQNNLCAICGNYMKKVCIDHCHDTKKVRGLLCHNCNTGIGQLKHDVEIMKNAIDYITNK